MKTYPDVMTPEYCVGVLELGKATAAEQRAAARHLSEALTDAARYQWLRDKGAHRQFFASATMSAGRGPYVQVDMPSCNRFSSFVLTREILDAQVDEAMAAPIGEKR